MMKPAIFRMSCPLALVVVIALSACSLLPPYAAAPEFPRLAPAALGQTRTALQIVHGAYGEHDMAFQCVVDVSPERLTLVGLGAQGQRWFSLRDDGSRLEAELSPQAPAQLEPQRVLLDLQLALWPLVALQQAFAGSDWQVSEPAPATRRLRRGDRLIAEVHYSGADPWRGRLWLSNFEFRYSLVVESQPLP